MDGIKADKDSNEEVIVLTSILFKAGPGGGASDAKFVFSHVCWFGSNEHLQLLGTRGYMKAAALPFRPSALLKEYTKIFS